MKRLIVLAAALLLSGCASNPIERFFPHFGLAAKPAVVEHHTVAAAPTAKPAEPVIASATSASPAEATAPADAPAKRTLRQRLKDWHAQHPIKWLHH